MNTKNFAIGVLSITATLLFVGLVLIHALSTPTAQAVAQNARGGDYLIATGQLDAAVEVLFVLDAAVPSMAVYQYNVARRALILHDVQPVRGLVARRATP